MDFALDIRGIVIHGIPMLTWTVATQGISVCFSWPVPENVQQTISLADQIYESIIKESAKAYREASENVNGSVPETTSPDSLVSATGQAQESPAN